MVTGGAAQQLAESRGRLGIHVASRFGQSIAAGIVSLAVYVATLCPTVYVEGSGELIGATHLLGTAHPTGYPLYCLIGRLFSAFLPFANVAFKINLATAFTGAATAAALCALLQSRGCGRGPAFCSALAFAFSQTFWSQSVIAEVYGLSTLLAVLVVAVGLRACAGADLRWYLLLVYLMGLGVTTHLSQVLLWPGLLVLFLWQRRKVVRSGGALGLAGLGFAAGVSPVVYLLIRNEVGPGFHWGPIDGLANLWSHITGELYRTSFGTVPWPGAVLNAQRWAEQMVDEYHPLLVPVIAWGVWVAWKRDRQVALVVGAAVLCNLIAAWNYHRDPNGIAVFFLLSVLGGAIFLGFSLDDIGARLARFGSPVAGRWAPGLVIVAAVFAANYYESDRSDNWIVYDYGREILQELPDGAVLITEGDDAMFVVDYLQRIERMRPDVLLFSRVGRGTDMLTAAEKRFHPARRRSLRLAKEASWLQKGRQLHYLLPIRIPDRRKYEFVPVRLTYSAVPKGRRAATRIDTGLIDLTNALKSHTYRDAWVRKIQSNYWFMKGALNQHEEEVEAALKFFERAATVAHDSRTVRFNTGLIYYKNGQLQDAARHLRASLAIDPLQPQARRLLGEIRRKQERRRSRRQ